jgi:ATP-dependent DNA ligase
MGRSTRLRTDFATQADVAALWARSRRRAGASTKATGRWLSSNCVWGQIPNGRHRRLLRVRRERPRNRRAEQRDGQPLTHLPLRERRRKLEAFARRYLRDNTRIRLSPATTRPSEAKAWLKDVGATLDGIIAKRCDLEYRSGNRTGMQKIKYYRSADCVVGGFRYNEGKPVVGSLLLGLYDDDGLLHHVGFTSTIPRDDNNALTLKLKKLIAPPGFTGNSPGGPSRWSTRRSAQWQPVKPELVVEVRYDHFTGHRFRHGTKFLRWRPDKSPRQCTMDQVMQKTADLTF